MTGLLTVDEAAARVGVSRRAIYNWMAAGRLRFSRTPGGCRRIYADSLLVTAGVPADAASEQAAPVPNELPSCQDMAIADIEARKAVGLERYGTLLQPHNGRDFLLDAYQEALDLAVYLRGCLYERDGK